MIDGMKWADASLVRDTGVLGHLSFYVVLRMYEKKFHHFIHTHFCHHVENPRMTCVCAIRNFLVVSGMLLGSGVGIASIVNTSCKLGYPPLTLAPWTPGGRLSNCGRPAKVVWGLAR